MAGQYPQCPLCALKNGEIQFCPFMFCQNVNCKAEMNYANSKYCGKCALSALLCCQCGESFKSGPSYINDIKKERENYHYYNGFYLQPLHIQYKREYSTYLMELLTEDISRYDIPEIIAKYHATKNTRITRGA